MDKLLHIRFPEAELPADPEVREKHQTQLKEVWLLFNMAASTCWLAFVMQLYEDKAHYIKANQAKVTQNTPQDCL